MHSSLFVLPVRPGTWFSCKKRLQKHLHFAMVIYPLMVSCLCSNMHHIAATFILAYCMSLHAQYTVHTCSLMWPSFECILLHNLGIYVDTKWIFCQFIGRSAQLQLIFLLGLPGLPLAVVGRVFFAGWMPFLIPAMGYKAWKARLWNHVQVDWHVWREI